VLAISILMTLVGAGLLIAALRHASFLYEHAGPHRSRWRSLFALLVLFIVGYLGFCALLLLQDQAPGLEAVIVSSVFLGGGVFALGAINLSVLGTKHLLAVAAAQREDALHDHLTRLPNRLLFVERTNQNLLMARRTGQALCVLVMDLDGFKEINDRLGHEAGDEVLVALAPRIKQGIRESDLACRMGGDEFAVVLMNCGVEEAVGVAVKITDAIAQPIFVKGSPLSVSISIGIAAFPQHGAETAALIRHADRAMYRAKRAGEPVVYSKQEEGTAP
jgi:diguanylate cyclase (GGDEF)-like protein